MPPMDDSSSGVETFDPSSSDVSITKVNGNREDNRMIDFDECNELRR